MIRDGCVVEVTGDLSEALRRFKKQVEKAGITREIRRHSEYQKPSAAREDEVDPRANETATC